MQWTVRPRNFDNVIVTEVCGLRSCFFLEFFFFIKQPRCRLLYAVVLVTGRWAGKNIGCVPALRGRYRRWAVAVWCTRASSFHHHPLSSVVRSVTVLWIKFHAWLFWRFWAVQIQNRNTQGEKEQQKNTRLRWQCTLYSLWKPHLKSAEKAADVLNVLLI